MKNKKKIFIKLKNIDLDISKFNDEYRLINSKKVKISNHKILEDISLDLQSGDKLGLIGQNGSGKSTLLKIIAEIYKPTAGTYLKNGSCIGFFGNIFYDEYLLGVEFIRNSLMLFGHSNERIDEEIDDIINFVDIGDYINKTFHTYSEGMKARVSLATVIFAKPSILLIDEGIGAGDRFFIKKTKKVIDKILKETPILIMASHDEKLLNTFCTKSILMKNGKIIMHSETSKVLEYYKSKDFQYI